MKPTNVNKDGTVEYVLRWLKPSIATNRPAEVRWARIVGQADFALECADSAWQRLSVAPETEILTTRPEAA